MPKRRVAEPAADVAPTTRPVKNIETKVKPARFTTVPAPEVPMASPKKAPAKPRFAALAGSESAAKIPAPSKVVRKLFRLPKLPKIALMDGVTGKAGKTKVARKALPRKRLLGTGHIALLALLVAAAFRPSLVAAGVFIWFVVMVGLFLLVGPQRIWRAIGWMVNQYGTVNKAGADRVFDWLDTVAVRWDAVLDRFPDGMVDTLYMPDFANLDALELEAEDAMSARLDRMHEQV